MERPPTAFTSSVHSINLGPSIGCARYAFASALEEIAYACAIQLLPRPLIWGNTNHIQCPSFSPRSNSDRTWSKTFRWASTKRSNLNGSLILTQHLKNVERFICLVIQSAPAHASQPSDELAADS